MRHCVPNVLIDRFVENVPVAPCAAPTQLEVINQLNDSPDGVRLRLATQSLTLVQVQGIRLMPWMKLLCR